MRLRLCSSLLALSAATISTHAGADPVLRDTRDLRGDFVMFGNAAGYECGNGAIDPIVGDVSACPNPNQMNQSDSSPDLFWRSQDPDATSAVADGGIDLSEARTTAILDLPPGATVNYARIYWAGLVDDPASADDAILLERPGAALGATISADDTATVDRGMRLWYQSTAEITAQLQANGEGAYRVSGLASIDLRALNSADPILAWVAVVVYELASDQPRNIAIFDGLDLVENGAPQNVSISGFFVPNAFDAKLGVITYEGEDSLTGDQLIFNGTALSDAVNPVDNFFNSSRSYLGTALTVPGDLPQLSGEANTMSGVDFDVVDVAAQLSPGDESATISATSSEDTYLLGAFVTSISTFRPNFETSNKSFEDANGGLITPGDVIEYTIVAENTGNDTSIDTVLSDALPLGVTYVADSLEIDAIAKTDDEGDDEGEYDASTRTITVRLGQGATEDVGGEMAPGESATIAFQVRVDSDFVGTISNQAIISAEGELGAPPTDFPTDSDGDEPGSQPTDVTVQGCQDDDDCDSATAPDCLPDNTCGCAAGAGECATDTDGDGLSDDEEGEIGTDPNDADSDDDGAADGAEIMPGEDSDGDDAINALDPDSDDDGLFDGTELGLDCEGADTDQSADTCIADEDPDTTTNPLDSDTDDGGVSDGDEDADKNGVINGGETDPNDPSDDDMAPGAGGAGGDGAGGSAGSAAAGRGGTPGRGGSGSVNLSNGSVEGGGCSCRTTPSSNGALWTLFGSLLTALSLGRRRTHR